MQIPSFPNKCEFLVKSKVAATLAAILDDVPVPSGAITHSFSSSCRSRDRLSIKGKIFSKYCNTEKSQGRGLRVRSRVKYLWVLGALSFILFILFIYLSFRIKKRQTGSSNNDLFCTGGDNNYGLLISELDGEQLNISVNDSIVGRGSNPFIAKVRSYLLIQILLQYV